MGRETLELEELVLRGTSSLGATIASWRPVHLATGGWGSDGDSHQDSTLRKGLVLRGHVLIAYRERGPSLQANTIVANFCL